MFRSYFQNKTNMLTNSEGLPTGAIFGVLNTIFSLQKQYSDYHFVLVFDAKG